MRIFKSMMNFACEIYDHHNPQSSAKFITRNPFIGINIDLLNVLAYYLSTLIIHRASNESVCRCRNFRGNVNNVGLRKKSSRRYDVPEIVSYSETRNILN